MNWRSKARVLRVLSALPRGYDLHYLMQRLVTRSLPVRDSQLRSSVATAREHTEHATMHSDRPLREQTWFEFGAGWNLSMPLANYGLGVGKQVVVDIRPLARPGLMNDAIARMASMPETFTRPFDHQLPSTRPFEALERHYSIQYLAPCDARDTGLPAGSMDVVTSTSTLEHIGTEDIPPILRECWRLLRPGGLMSMYINYKDHFAAVDSTIGPYNFLRFTAREWDRFSPALHFQNRLRHLDYINMMRAAGFTVVEERPVTEITDAVLEELAAIPIADEFRGYSPRELAAQDCFVVAVKG